MASDLRTPTAEVQHQARQVLAFWFDALLPEQWFRKAEGLDREIADLFGLDVAVANDIATIVGYLGQRPGAIYIDALGFAEEMQDIIALWRKPVSTSAT